MGAEWVSGGWQAIHWIDGVLEARTDEFGGRDATMRLQEIRQGDGKSRPTYTYRERGSGHAPEYQCQVFFDDVCVGESGYFSSKKIARKEAAANALAALAGNGGET